MKKTYTSNATLLAKAIADYAKPPGAATLPVVFKCGDKTMFMKSADDIQTVERNGEPHRIEIQLHEDRRQ